MSMSRKVIERLESGESAEAIAADMGLDVSRDHDGDDVEAVLLPGWHASDAYCVDEEYPDAASGEEAAQAHVDTAEWGNSLTTQWIHVSTWREGLTVDAFCDVELVREREDEHVITLEPKEPECSHEDGHDWQSPHEIVGGLRENPGCRGHGGGVIQEEVCVRCGCGRTTDTWAQDPADGSQGHRQVTYEPGRYEHELDELEEGK